MEAARRQMSWTGELRQAAKTENGISSRDEAEKPGDDQGEGSSNSEEPIAKRRRSQVSRKRFGNSEGCGKSHSRAEHL